MEKTGTWLTLQLQSEGHSSTPDDEKLTRRCSQTAKDERSPKLNGQDTWDTSDSVLHTVASQALALFPSDVPNLTKSAACNALG